MVYSIAKYCISFYIKCKRKRVCYCIPSSVGAGGGIPSMRAGGASVPEAVLGTPPMRSVADFHRVPCSRASCCLI